MDNFHCTICQTNFKTKRVLQKHKERGGCEKVYSSNDCGKRSKFSLENHKNYCPAKSYDCQKCQKSFKTVEELKRHTGIEQKITCAYCDFEATDNEDMIKHNKDNHLFSCEECEVIFTSETDIGNHIDSIHNNISSFCGTAYPKKDNKVAHESSCSLKPQNPPEITVDIPADNQEDQLTQTHKEKIIQCNIEQVDFNNKDGKI